MIYKSISFIFFINLALIISIFSNIYIGFFEGLILLFILTKFLLKNTTKTRYFILFITYVTCYKLIDYKINEYFINHKLILSSNNISGTIISKEKAKNRFIYTINLYKCKNFNRYKKINGKIIIFSNQNAEISDFVYIKNIFWFTDRLNTIDECKNEKFYKGILAYGQCGKIEFNKEFYRMHIRSIFEYLFSLKESLYKCIQNTFDEKTLSIYESIFLGKTDNLINTDRNSFVQWGLAHHLARAGLHLNIINNFIMNIFGFFAVNYNIGIILSLFFILFFNTLSVSSIPFERASLTWTINGLCNLYKIYINSLNIFSVCTIIFIIFNPFIVLSLSFQLSFFCTGILLLINFYKN